MGVPRNQQVEIVLRELDRWDGVSHSIENGGRHARLVLRRGDQSTHVLLSYGRKSSGGRRNLSWITAQVRKAMREIGATPR